MKVKIEERKKIDIAEVLARSEYAGDPEAEAKLTYFLDRSVYTWAGMVNNKTACVFGLIAPTVLADEAYLWLITTDLVKDNEFLFIRYSQRFIETVLSDFTTIVGDVSITNERAKRWLRWLGARINTDMAVEGFAPFSIKVKRA